jgi:hypothetical protein
VTSIPQVLPLGSYIAFIIQLESIALQDLLVLKSRAGSLESTCKILMV